MMTPPKPSSTLSLVSTAADMVEGRSVPVTAGAAIWAVMTILAPASIPARKVTISHPAISSQLFDEAAKRCEQILTEHAEQLRAIAEYLLQHETMEKEVFDHFFATGEFPKDDPKLARQARSDATIERPARKIAMTDGYAEDAALPESGEAEAEPTEEAEEKPQTDPPEEK